MGYYVLNINGTKRISSKINASQNSHESSLLSEDGSLSDIFRYVVQLTCWNFLGRERLEKGFKGNQGP